MPNTMRRTLQGTIAAIALCIAPTVSVAGGLLDGRTGPVTMTGTALDDALVSLNGYLQAKYIQDETLAHLDAVPATDFESVVIATGRVPHAVRTEVERTDFGWPVSGGTSLDLQLARFNEDVMGRGESLFVRIARAEAGKLPGFVEAAADYKPDLRNYGPIRDDRTLDAEMQNLMADMFDFADRAAELSQAVPATTGASFDRYTGSLLLF